jgi:hypothetical protein
LEDMVPFEDTITRLYPKYLYADLTIFKLIHSAKIRITDKEGNNVENVRLKHPKQKSPIAEQLSISMLPLWKNYSGKQKQTNL